MYPYCTTSGVAPLRRSPPPPAVYLLDHFIDANGTDITAHTMDIGPGWQVSEEHADATELIEGNKLQIIAPTQGDTLCFSDASHSEGAATVTMSIGKAGANSGIAFRLVDSGNFCLAQIDLTSGDMEIWRVDGGLFVKLANRAFAGAINTDYLLLLRSDNDSITFSIDGGAPLTITSVAHLGVTNWGTYTGGEVGNTTITYSNFKVGQ